MVGSIGPFDVFQREGIAIFVIFSVPNFLWVWVIFLVPRHFDSKFVWPKKTFIWTFGPFLGHYDPFCLYSLPTIFYVQWGNIAIPSFKKLVFNTVYYCILLSGKYRHTCDTVREVLVSMYSFNVYFCHTFDCKSYIAVESTDTCVTRWRWGARGLGGSFVETCFPPRADLRCHLFLCPPPVRLPSSWWLGTNVEEK